MSKDGSEEKGCAWMMIAIAVGFCLFMATCGYNLHVERLDEIELEKAKSTNP